MDSGVDFKCYFVGKQCSLDEIGIVNAPRKSVEDLGRVDTMYYL
jgi:hypothetical protein